MTSRPLFHFTPQKHWINDPNGLVFYAGEYHLFYQYHPESSVWGPMHWGHAVSKDLLQWQELDIALYPDALGTIFSGSALIDWQDTAGFGAEAMVAVFTHHLESHHSESPNLQELETTQPHPYLQQQSLAYSHDKGRSWHKYAGNPVLSPDEKSPDFRDPKVFWYEAAQHWVMCLAAGHEIRFYRSTDLKDWHYTGTFGQQGALDGVWETPELFLLPVQGSKEQHWLLSVGVADGSSTKGSGQQYFIGDFDGATFHNANPAALVLWADYGADFYAAQSWNDSHKSHQPDRRIWLGWMNNWRYGDKTPSEGWRGMMSLPRELALVARPEGIRLAQQPLAELAELRRQAWHYPEKMVAEGVHTLPVQGQALEIVLEFPAPAEGQRLGLELHADAQHHVTVYYDGSAQHLLVRRATAEQADFHEDFAREKIVPLAHHGEHIRLHMVLDSRSLELFAAEGSVVISEQLLPSDGTGLRIFSQGGSSRLEQCCIWQLATS